MTKPPFYDHRRFPARAFALLAGLICLLAPLSASAQASAPKPPKPFVIAVDSAAETYGGRLVTLVYGEAFRRLGIPLQIEHYTLARRTALVEEGIADGESSRVYAYGATRPHLVRVEESIIDLDFALYTANPKIQLQHLDDLRNSKLLVEYRRGILLCEKTLRGLVAPERLSDVPTHQQGMRKLIAGRTDLYCELEPYVKELLDTPEFKNTPVRKVISVGDAVPTYPYLNKRHAELAPRMAAVFKQMKAEGLLDAYRRQVERELGW